MHKGFKDFIQGMKNNLNIFFDIIDDHAINLNSTMTFQAKWIEVQKNFIALLKEQTQKEKTLEIVREELLVSALDIFSEYNEKAFGMLTMAGALAAEDIPDDRLLQNARLLRNTYAHPQNKTLNGFKNTLKAKRAALRKVIEEKTQKSS